MTNSLACTVPQLCLTSSVTVNLVDTYFHIVLCIVFYFLLQMNQKVLRYLRVELGTAGHQGMVRI